MIVGIIYDEQVKADILVLMDNLTSDTKTFSKIYQDLTKHICTGLNVNCKIY
jgi:hypothetical protein